MKRSHRFCFAAALLIAFASAAVMADIDAGLKALQAGDFARAESELSAEANAGNVRAQILMGRLYREPRNPARNPATAYEWLKRAAEGGDAGASYWVGVMTQLGEGTTKDTSQAVAWWRKAAEGGHAPAMGVLAASYLNGSGVPKDPAEAVRWARTGATLNDVVAQSILGRAYLYGEGGLKRNLGQGLQWTRLAASRGEANAQTALGRLYADGVGVPQSYVHAHLWFNLAASRGHSHAAKQREEIAAKMTPEQLAEAQKLATAWRPSRGKPASQTEPGATGAKLRRTGSGSGFIVDAGGNILTNHHVVKGCEELRLPAHGITAQVSSFDERNDLALLQSAVAAEELPKFRSTSSVRLGESVVVAGFPLGELLSGGLNITTGSVSALSGPRNNKAMMQITAPVQAGSSGGPVLDQSGNVVGVVVSKLNALKVAAVTGDVPQNVNFAINGATARGFLEKNGVALEDAGAVAPAAATADVAERAKRYTVLIECWR